MPRASSSLPPKCAHTRSRTVGCTQPMSGMGSARVRLAVGEGCTCSWSPSVPCGAGQRGWAGPPHVPHLRWAGLGREPLRGRSARSRWRRVVLTGGGRERPGGLGAARRPHRGGPGGRGCCPVWVWGPPPWASWGRSVGLACLWHPEPLTGRPQAQRAGGQLLSWGCCPPCPGLWEEAWLEMHVGRVRTARAGGSGGAGCGSCCCQWTARSWQGRGSQTGWRGFRGNQRARGLGRRPWLRGSGIAAGLSGVGGGWGGAGARRGGGGRGALYRAGARWVPGVRRWPGSWAPGTRRTPLGVKPFGGLPVDRGAGGE